MMVCFSFLDSLKSKKLLSDLILTIATSLGTGGDYLFKLYLLLRSYLKKNRISYPLIATQAKTKYYKICNGGRHFDHILCSTNEELIKTKYIKFKGHNHTIVSPKLI